jgi:hypothetical protein
MEQVECGNKGFRWPVKANPLNVPFNADLAAIRSGHQR